MLRDVLQVTVSIRLEPVNVPLLARPGPRPLELLREENARAVGAQVDQPVDRHAPLEPRQRRIERRGLPARSTRPLW